jgi:hypothetical protein
MANSSLPAAQDNSLRKLERFHAYLLLVVGIAFLGAGITVIGLVTASPVTAAVGAGAIAAAGLLSIVFAIGGLSLNQDEAEEISPESAKSAQPLVHDPYSADPTWPLKTSRRSAM